jgi:hypothetical protein
MFKEAGHVAFFIFFVFGWREWNDNHVAFAPPKTKGTGE